jgi:parallel beta-helix repeat protein
VLEGRGFTLGSQNGLSLSSVANVTVKDLNVKAHYLHLALQHAQNCTLLRTNSSYSIAFSDSNNNLIDDCFGSIILERSSNNTIKDCLTGPIELNKSDGNSILNNNCSYPGRSLSLADSSDNLLFGNRFSGMAWWISMYGSSNGNSIVGNEIRMGPRYYADSLTGGNYIYHNNFMDFALNQSLSAPVNIWSSNMKGNYWADYYGTDANHDGVGDTPYIIDKTNTDNYPLMAPVNIAAEPLP